jgi:hypothetical protein
MTPAQFTQVAREDGATPKQNRQQSLAVSVDVSQRWVR